MFMFADTFGHYEPALWKQDFPTVLVAPHERDCQYGQHLALDLFAFVMMSAIMAHIYIGFSSVGEGASNCHGGKRFRLDVILGLSAPRSGVAEGRS